MISLHLLFTLTHHFDVTATAFQLQQRTGFARHPWRPSCTPKIEKQWLQHPHLRPTRATPIQRGGGLMLATDDSDSSLSDMLGIVAAETKEADASSSEEDVASTTTEGDDGSSKNVSGSSDTTGKLASSDKTNGVDSSSFTPSPDTPLANKYYSEKMQPAGETQKVETPVKEKSTEIADVPPPAPRRRFDFGIASERVEPINGEAIVQDSASGDATTAMRPSLGFSEQARPYKLSFEGGELSFEEKDDVGGISADAKKNPGDATNPPNDAAANNAGEGSGTTKLPGDTAKFPSKSVIRDESPAAKSVAADHQASVSKTDIKDGKFSHAESPLKDAKTPAASISKGEESTTSSKAISSKSSTELIQTQAPSPTYPLTLPAINLDVEDFGYLPLIVIGISFYLSLGVYLKQASGNDDGYAGSDEVRNKDVDENGLGPLAKINKESKTLLQKVKDAGKAGIISYALWEAAFWGVSFPVCVVSYRQVTGHWPDVMNGEDARKVGLQAFAFVNLARLAVPIRIGLALSTVPWVEENIVDRFQGITTGNAEEELAKSEQLYSSDDITEEIEDGDSSTISQVEKSLNRMDTEASRISYALENFNAGIDPSLLQKKKKKEEEETKRYVPGSNYLGGIDEYCEPGQVDENCSESIQGYLDTLANTGAVATDREVKTIVSYLDSVSSNVTPNKKTGAAFASYLDALSTGYVPAPPSAKAVASYLDVLSSSDEIIATTSSPPAGVAAEVARSKDEIIGSRINEVEERLSRLESSVSSLPDDIASRLLDWQMSQDKKLSDEMDKIMKLLVDGKALEK